MRYRGFISLRALWVPWLAFVGGCGTAAPPAVRSNVVEPEEARTVVPGRADQVLSEPQRRDAMAAMRSVAEGERAAERPEAAPDGVRWTDIPLAVGFAVDQVGVEMTIRETVTEPDRYVFRLQTLEGWPGTLAIRRVEGPQVYEVEDVRVGLFPEYARHVKRGERLVKEFEKQLKVLGAHKRFSDD